jgi:ACR3 family arsenite efflux pump ArsB
VLSRRPVWTLSPCYLQYLGIPLAAGAITRVLVLALLSEERRQCFFGYFGLLGEAGLLYVIIVLFMNQGRAIIHNIGTVFRICVPCVLFSPHSCLHQFDTWLNARLPV